MQSMTGICAQPLTDITFIMDAERLLDAMNKCCNGVRWKRSIQEFEINKLRWAASIRKAVLLGTFKSKGFVQFDIVERGRLRHIQSVHVSERTVQKLICNYALKPYVLPKLIYDNTASQEGKGTEFALKRLVEHLRWHYARYGNEGAAAVIDFHDFFGSIPHAEIIDELTDESFDALLAKYIADFINAFDGDYGLGLGSEISQVAAIYYPTDIDRFIQEQMHIHCYGRYMDDTYIFHPDRTRVERCVEYISQRAEERHITLNVNKTKIHNLRTDTFVFLKKRVRLLDNGKVLLRLSRENINEERKRIVYMRSEYDNGRMPIDSIKQSYASWRGHAKKYNAYHVIGDMDKYFYGIMGDILNEKCTIS